MPLLIVAYSFLARYGLSGECLPVDMHRYDGSPLTNQTFPKATIETL